MILRFKIVPQWKMTLRTRVKDAIVGKTVV